VQYNKCIFVGRLTRDPEAKQTGSGISVTSFSIAVNRPQSAEQRQSGAPSEVDFIECVAWQKLAETVATYMKTGMLILVEGRLQIRSYEIEGQKRKAAEIVASEVRFMEKRQDNGEAEQPERAGRTYGRESVRSRTGYSTGEGASDGFGDDPFGGEG
jgi:single-strand DNA-binding protein